ncbi:TIGR03086 family metal-binding protein [Actinomadura macrotermitis]|uniref:Mycothiol-dependent maleylpyruvate isomerase metal-binding domain-containing protein n=1 Tax=Actinomadura macrotermitis TaxID=2585200 RepID=A0A7K0BLD0_9ACTN|nr:TIGR03086 family metal-binding protein [Actinomadura macrotermitis]MQY01988.1 hypothetical protein [Actinomadura macrotermitis]
MELRELMPQAADAAARIVRSVPSDALDGPTPCPDWDVRALVNHLVYWTGRGEGAARKRHPAGPGQDHDFTADAGWAEDFAAQARRTAEAWADPAAWTGDTSLSGTGPGMPAAVIGGMIFGEWITHGWDLAVATRQPHDFAPELVQAAYDALAPIAAMAREYGAFGPEVPVPADAPLLDRLLGLSGRDPHRAA